MVVIITTYGIDLFQQVLKDKELLEFKGITYWKEEEWLRNEFANTI
jgi:hypothetical protein